MNFYSWEMLMVMIIGNKALCHPVWSVIIFVVIKSESHFADVRFWYLSVLLQTELDYTQY